LLRLLKDGQTTTGPATSNLPYPASPPKRGEIYWVNFNPARGSEQAGRRPAVVISLDSFNSHMPVVAVAAISTKIKPYNFTVDLPPGKPLTKHSQILAFQVITVDRSRLDGYMGTLDAEQIGKLEAALRVAWGL
jgi:mRNA interferase MazF